MNDSIKNTHSLLHTTFSTVMKNLFVIPEKCVTFLSDQISLYHLTLTLRFEALKFGNLTVQTVILYVFPIVNIFHARKSIN